MRTARHGLLGRLEDDADGAAQRGFLVHAVQHQGDAQHGGGVDVVAAGMGDAVVLRRERQARFLDDGQGIDVAAQGGGDGAFADVHGQAGAVQPPGLQAGGFEPFHELVSGAEFLEGQLGVRVQVPAEVDQFRQERLQPRPHQCGGLSFSSVIAHIIYSSERPRNSGITGGALRITRLAFPDRRYRTSVSPLALSASTAP